MMMMMMIIIIIIIITIICKTLAMNTWAVALLRYGAGVLKWRKDEVAAMDSKTRQLMTMYGALHPKSDIHRLYLQRDKG